jgi:peptide/nickel transport system substrate-binding protein
MAPQIRIRLAVGMLLTASIAGGALAHTALAQESPAADEKITLNVGLTGDFVSPNPFVALNSMDYEFLFLNYDMLLNFDPVDLSPAPGLAESCEPSSDHMDWTCTIREGVMWSDGQPLTAEDIAFTFEFIVENKGTGFFADYLPFDPTFEAPDATTFIWHSSEPTFAPEIPPWIYILPKHIWEPLDGKSAGEIKGFEEIPAVGSGAFNMVEWEPGQFSRFVANKNYWNGTPVIDEIVYRSFENQEAMVQALRAGEIDYAFDLSPTLANSLEGSPDIEVYPGAPGSWTNLAFNFGGQSEAAGSEDETETNHPALQDIQLREAIAHAVDKQAIVDTIYQGFALPADSFMRADSVFWHLDIPQDEEFQFDLELARQMLDDAGYADTDGDGVREDPLSGLPLAMDIVTITEEYGSVDSGKLIEGWLEEIGFDIKLRPVTETKINELWTDGDFDMYIWGWAGDIDPDFIMSVFTTDSCGVWSDGCWSDPQYDQWYEEQKTLFDRNERKELIDQMQLYLYKELPELALAYEQTIHAYRTDRFTGYVPVPEDGGDLLFSWGPYSHVALRPVTAGTSESDGGGIPVGVWIALGIGVVAIAVIVLIRRGREEEDERI